MTSLVSRPSSAPSAVLHLQSSGLEVGPGVPAGKSNSGEGGEDPVRWEYLGDIDDKGNSPTLPHLKGLQTGDTANSRIKQVCSGVWPPTNSCVRAGHV